MFISAMTFRFTGANYEKPKIVVVNITVVAVRYLVPWVFARGMEYHFRKLILSEGHNI